MTELDWDRWHDLLDIQAERPFTPVEQAEYEAFLLLVKAEDAEEERVARESLRKADKDFEDLKARVEAL